MSLSALNDIMLTQEDIKGLQASRDRLFRFKAKAQRQYGKKGEEFVAAYMACAQGFRCEPGYYHPEMQAGYDQAAKDKAKPEE